jgi:hypothetical protein
MESPDNAAPTGSGEPGSSDAPVHFGNVPTLARHPWARIGVPPYPIACPSIDAKDNMQDGLEEEKRHSSKQSQARCFLAEHPQIRRANEAYQTIESIQVS